MSLLFKEGQSLTKVASTAVRRDSGWGRGSHTSGMGSRALPELEPEGLKDGVGWVGEHRRRKPSRRGN